MGQASGEALRERGWHGLPGRATQVGTSGDQEGCQAKQCHPEENCRHSWRGEDMKEEETKLKKRRGRKEE